jgi:hypothetical protein
MQQRRHAQPATLRPPPRHAALRLHSPNTGAAQRRHDRHMSSNAMVGLARKCRRAVGAASASTLPYLIGVCQPYAAICPIDIRWSGWHGVVAERIGSRCLQMLHIITSNGPGFVVGVFAALAAVAIQRQVDITWVRIRSTRLFRQRLFDYDPTLLGQFQLNSWSQNRRLSEDDIVIETADPPRQTWCEQQDLDERRRQVDRPGGASWYITDFVVDDRESDATQKFHLRLAPSTFGDYEALTDLLAARRDIVARLTSLGRLPDGPRSLVQGSPPTTLGVHVNVVSAEGSALAFRRSAAVRRAQRLWMMGCGETITRDDIVGVTTPGSPQRGLVRFCERALREEVGLEPSDYGPIFISWLGLDVRQGLNWIIAHVKSQLSEAQIDTRIGRCHSTFEMTELTWLKVHRRRQLRRTLREMEESEKVLSPDDATRQWIPGQRLVLRELLRVGPAVLQK